MRCFIISIVFFLICLTVFSQVTPKKTYFERKVIFNVRIIPVVYFDVRSTQRINTYLTGNYFSTPQTKEITGGAHIEVGPSTMEKRFCPNLAMGFEGNSTSFVFTLYPDFNLNLIKGKFAPTLHLGAGYASQTVNYPTPPKEKINYNGATALAGLAFNAEVKKHFSISIGLDYRFIYTSAVIGTLVDFNGTNTGKNEVADNFRHQLGIRLSFIFF